MAEPGTTHRLFDARVIRKGAQVDAEVAVFGGLRYRHGCAAGLQVDGLCSDHNYRITVRVQGDQGVEEHRSRSGQ